MTREQIRHKHATNTDRLNGHTKITVEAVIEELQQWVEYAKDYSPYMGHILERHIQVLKDQIQ